MTKDILKLTATLLGLDDVFEYLTNEETQEPSSEVQIKINQLISYVNYVMREVTKEYFPLKTHEVVTSDNQCQIFFNTLSKTPISIQDIKDQHDLSVTFNLYPDFIKIGKPSQTYEIFYNYIPASISSIEDTLSLPIGLDYFVISYGVASEYALSKLLYSEAELWESKFKKALENVKSRVGERRFFARRLK